MKQFESMQFQIHLYVNHFIFSFLTSNVRRWSSSLFNESHLFPSLYKYLQFYTMLFISINEIAIDLITSSSVEQWWES